MTMGFVFSNFPNLCNVQKENKKKKKKKTEDCIVKIVGGQKKKRGNDIISICVYRCTYIKKTHFFISFICLPSLFILLFFLWNPL